MRALDMQPRKAGYFFGVSGHTRIERRASDLARIGDQGGQERRGAELKIGRAELA